ncbi:MAG: acyl carrier protein [Actinocatenispora sp.]
MSSVPEPTVQQSDGEQPSGTVLKLRQVVETHLKLDTGVLRRDFTLGDDLCLDSLAAAELLVAIEEDMHLELPTSLMAGREGVTYGELEDIVCDRADSVG